MYISNVSHCESWKVHPTGTSLGVWILKYVRLTVAVPEQNTRGELVSCFKYNYRPFLL